MGLIAITVFIISIQQVLPLFIGSGGGGRYYILFEGVYPRKFENDYIRYDSCFEPLNEDDQSNKRMYGMIVVKKKWEHIRGTSILLKEGTNDWKIAQAEKTHKNLCKLSIPTRFFQDRFSGTKGMDMEICTLEKGTYYLRDYSFEDELKNLTSLMTFGHYNLTVSILADIEGKEAKIASGSVLMWSKDEKKKKYEQKLKKWPKCNKYD